MEWAARPFRESARARRSLTRSGCSRPHGTRRAGRDRPPTIRRPSRNSGLWESSATPPREGAASRARRADRADAGGTAEVLDAPLEGPVALPRARERERAPRIRNDLDQARTATP